MVQNIDFSRYSKDKPLVSNTNDTTLKAILKYRNHPSIIAIQNKYKGNDSFNFIRLIRNILKKSFKTKLDINKASMPKKTHHT